MTGVQTCALPISHDERGAQALAAVPFIDADIVDLMFYGGAEPDDAAALTQREQIAGAAREKLAAFGRRRDIFGRDADGAAQIIKAARNKLLHGGVIAVPVWGKGQGRFGKGTAAVHHLPDGKGGGKAVFPQQQRKRAVRIAQRGGQPVVYGVAEIGRASCRERV